MPVAAAVDGCDVRLVGRRAAQPLSDERGDGRTAQRAQWQLDRPAARDQLTLDGQRRVIGGQVDDPARGQHEEPRRLDPARHRRDPFEGGGVGPLQVVEVEHDGLDLGHGLQRLTQLTPRPLGGGARRGMRRGLAIAAHAAHRVEHRPERLAAAVLLDALAVGHDQRRALMRGQERLDQRALADASLAGDEGELPVAAGRAGQQIAEHRELAVAADERRGRATPRGRDTGDHGLRRTGRDIARGRQRHGGDEPVADAVQRLDVPRTPRIVVERLAQRLDLEAERVVAHDDVAPDRVEERRLGEHAPGLAGQRPEERHGLRRQPHLPAVRRQRPVRSREPVRAEAQRVRVRGGRGRRGHGGSPRPSRSSRSRSSNRFSLSTYPQAPAARAASRSSSPS